MHSVEMTENVLRFADSALGKPYHAAIVDMRASGGVSALHGHADFFEFMAVFEGQGRQLLPTGVQALRPGDVVLVGPQDRHALQGLAPGGLRFANIAFPAAAWQGFIDIVRLTGMARQDEPPIWRLDPATAKQVRTVFQLALDRFHYRPVMLDLLRFWTDLAELLGAGEQGADRTRQPEWLVRVRAAMQREEHLSSGVPRMLELASVSPAHLSRTMRQFYGTTPTAFITELRLERAAELLGTTSESVTRIAQRCGFTSQSYFTRCFSRAHGFAPTEYRRRVWQAFVPD